ncbi:hypothetical protein RI543_002005 [Arxiozyma heterogenica]|uniref:PH domain-containing protein n=1 Tax=Arxiozyma heterogenica TaxID=278026 RepID=A0AAN7WI53_9SACH|nr:hypothetical protein RI543_002005 [Kazachstania heterogenica]
MSDTNGADVADLSKPLLKLRLLETLRDGSFDELSKFIATRFVSKDNPIIQELASIILHLAVQVAPDKLVKNIVTQWVDNPKQSKNILGLPLDINQRDENGNTPLHLAVLQSRDNIIQFFLDNENINEMIMNKDGLLPIDLCKNLNVAEMMQNKRCAYMNNVMKQADTAFERKDFNTLEHIFAKPRNQEFMDINKLDPLDHGNSLLHKYLLKGDVETCKWLLNHGANPLLKNEEGVCALDIIKTKQKTNKNLDPALKTLLNDILKEEAVVNATLAIEKPPTQKGYLKKYAHMGKGYKLRYFVLSEDGKLSYYKDPASYAANKLPRGSLELDKCYLHMDSTEKLKFEVIGGSNNSAKWKLKGNQTMETNSWVMAIQSAIRYAKDKKTSQKSKGQHGLKIDTSTDSLQTPTMILNSYKSPTLQKSNTFDAQYARKQNIGRQSNLSPMHRKFTDIQASDSSDIKLSNKLTESGKNYVNQMIDSRLERSTSLSRKSSIVEVRSKSTGPMTPLGSPKFMTSTAGISYMSMDNLDMSNRSFVGSPITTTKTANGINTGYQEGVVGEGTDSELEGDEENMTAKYNRDEEYLKVEYGPYVEKLNMYQRTIALELSTINEIIDSTDFINNNDTALVTIKESLLRLSSNITEMNSLTLKRDEKLVSMLAKQRDMNNVWIQTMKDLEIELENKTERLATLGRGRRTLKRTLKKKIKEVKSQGNMNSEISLQSLAKVSSCDTLNQIARFITATKEEDEDSAGDEFYDAEELVDESSVQESHVDIIHKDEGDVLSYTNTNASMPEEGNTNSDGGDVSLTHENMANNVKSISESLEGTDGPIIMESSHKTSNSAQFDDIKKKVEVEKPVKEEKQEEVVENAVDQSLSEKIPEKKLFAVTTAQKNKQALILKEGSYLGYEDGPRKKLALDKDERPRVSLWAVLKSMIGKDMTRMTLPVVFNEPTNLLQRVAEDMECSYLLDQAATFKDSTLRLLYVSVFTASCYASTVGRIAKPFNPILGETFEYARPDKNYRFFSEQVSHHPPISATWTESPKWDFYGESAVDTNFNGRSFGVKHLGLWYIKLRPDNGDLQELYTYKKPDNTVIGILVGNPQLDNHGEVHITNHTTGEYCILNFKARGWRSSSAYEIKGEVFNKNKEKVWILGGHWNDSIYAKKVTDKSGEEFIINEKNNGKNGKNNKAVEERPNYTGDKFLVWKAYPRPDSPFNLTQFAITLNAPQPHLLPWLAPTDTRLRPDQRAMENGEYDKAADEKNRVEQKQRAARKYRQDNNIQYQPQWFTHEVHPVTKQQYWKFKGNYWSIRRDKQLADKGDIF